MTDKPTVQELWPDAYICREDHEAALAQARQEATEAERKRCEQLISLLRNARFYVAYGAEFDMILHGAPAEELKQQIDDALAAVEKIQKEKL